MTVRTEGDALFAAFREAGAAVARRDRGPARAGGQPGPRTAPVRVRMGLHTGEAHLAGDDYGGFDVNRAARIAAVGHGGQIVLSETTRALVASALPAGVRVRDLGRHALKDSRPRSACTSSTFPGCAPTSRRSASPVRPTATCPDRLTTFVGRAADLAALDALLDDHRLVTLTGPGGIGKTSLAVELARSRERRRCPTAPGSSRSTA